MLGTSVLSTCPDTPDKLRRTRPESFTRYLDALPNLVLLELSYTRVYDLPIVLPDLSGALFASSRRGLCRLGGGARRRCDGLDAFLLQHLLQHSSQLPNLRARLGKLHSRLFERVCQRAELGI